MNMLFLKGNIPSSLAVRLIEEGGFPTVSVACHQQIPVSISGYSSLVVVQGGSLTPVTLPLSDRLLICDDCCQFEAQAPLSADANQSRPNQQTYGVMDEQLPAPPERPPDARAIARATISINGTESKTGDVSLAVNSVA